MFEKKLLVALSVSTLVLGSTCAYADANTAPAASSDDNSLQLTIPDLKTGFELNIAALALKPGASNLNYTIYNKALQPIATPFWTEKELAPAYAPAFELGARYVFAGGKDISLDWTHLNSNTTASVRADGIDYFVGPDYLIGPDAAANREALGAVRFKYDVVNLDVGQYLDFGKHVAIRFFGGLSTAFLRQDVTATYNGIVPDGFGHDDETFSMTSDNQSSDTAVGPRLGMHLSYNTDHDFGFFGEAAGSALIGTSHTTANYSTLSPFYASGTTPNLQSIADDSVTEVIPGFDAKVGMNYTHAFSKNAVFTLEGGYQAAVYINAIDEYKPQTLVEDEPYTTEGGIYVATMSHTQSNYSVQGPFLKFAVQFS